MAAAALSSSAAVRGFAGRVAAKPERAPRAARVAARAGSEVWYPEPGASTYSGNYDEALWPNWAQGKSEEQIKKVAETELIHGRWAMLGCAGAWGGEVGTGIPWFQAGKVCTPEDCTHIQFPGQVIPLAPEGTGYPSFYNVAIGTVIMMGLSEAYRGGLIKPVFSELTVGDLHPGGEHFDPLNLASFENDTMNLERLKMAELKNARLAMLSWLGYMSQAIATNCDDPFLPSVAPSYIEGAKGPYANWQDHVADPMVENVWKYMHWW